MKHAFLIMVHDNWEQLIKFLNAYHSSKCAFYIHVNSKVTLSDDVAKRIVAASQESRVIFTPRVPIIWGGAGILAASLVALRCAYDEGIYEYYHLLTGSDLPLVSIEKLDSFFIENVKCNHSNGKYYTNYISGAIPGKKMASRVECYNVFVPAWGRHNRFVRKMATLSNTAFCTLQRLCGINRIKKTGNTLYCGSSWWSISNEFAREVLENAEKLIHQYGKMTFAADEFAIQTLFMNSKYRSSKYEPTKDTTSNLRLLDFERGNGYGSPHIYTMADKDEIENTKNLFGRKFDIRVDSEIVNYILERIQV